MYKGKANDIIFYLCILFGLVLMTRNFLLFHAYAEGFTIVIAALIFVITWNSREYIDRRT